MTVMREKMSMKYAINAERRMMFSNWKEYSKKKEQRIFVSVHVERQCWLEMHTYYIQYQEEPHAIPQRHTSDGIVLSWVLLLNEQKKEMAQTHIQWDAVGSCVLQWASKVWQMCTCIGRFDLQCAHLFQVLSLHDHCNFQ